MVINMKNYGEIEYNYHDYADDQVWITMGINVGIATRYFLINDEKNFENNLAFANIFSNYLKHEYSQKYMIDVDRTVTSITYLSNREMIGEALVSFIKDICKLNLDSAVFEKVKQQTLENFKKVYKEGAFRGWYKSFEISDLNKGFTLKKLIQDLKDITFEEFVKSYDYLIHLHNAAIYVNGKIKGLVTEELNSLKQLFEETKVQTILGGRLNDRYLRGDAHLLEISREPINIDILAFLFDGNVDIFDRMIYLDIESEKLSYQDKIVHVDKFDSSIIVNEGNLMKLKNIFRSPLTEEQFIRNQKKIMQQYSWWLERNPERFGKWCVELMLNMIKPAEYLSTVANVAYVDYSEISKRIKPIIAEAQIVMRR